METVTPVAKDLVLVVDISGSMADKNKLTIVKKAANTMVKTLNLNDRVCNSDRVGFVLFNDNWSQ